MTINWRHKAGLFLTLVAVGLGLFLDSSIKQAVGIALLGIAFSWLIGNLTPRVLKVVFAIAICSLGLYLAVSPVWSDWESTMESAAKYEVGIFDLQYAINTAPIPIPPDATIGTPSVDYNALAKKYGGTTDSTPTIDWSEYSTPSTHLSIGVAKGKGQTHTATVPESVKRWVRPEQKTRNYTDAADADRAARPQAGEENEPVRTGANTVHVYRLTDVGKQFAVMLHSKVARKQVQG